MPETLVAEVTEDARQKCGASATTGARSGDVRVIVRKGPDAGTLVETESSGGLNEDDLNCVRSATFHVLEFLRREVGTDLWNYVGPGPLTFSVAFDRPAPPAPDPEL
jgi:hypothetical protein